MKQQNVSRMKVINYINGDLLKVKATNSDDVYKELEKLTTNKNDFKANFKKQRLNPITEEEIDQEDESKSPLERFTINLNQRAKSGVIDPLIGREKGS